MLAQAVPSAWEWDRELVLFIQDDQPLTQVGKSSGSSFNLRAEPLAARGGDPWDLFSSKIHGDPATPLLEAFAGDPLVIRALVSGTNDVHTLHTDGHWFRSELWSKKSAPTSTIQLGISERYDLVMPKAGGPQALAGDYRYYNGRAFKLREGSWGIIRVHDGIAGTPLKKLPGLSAVPRANAWRLSCERPAKAVRYCCYRDSFTHARRRQRQDLCFATGQGGVEFERKNSRALDPPCEHRRLHSDSVDERY